MHRGVGMPVWSRNAPSSSKNPSGNGNPSGNRNRTYNGNLSDVGNISDDGNDQALQIIAHLPAHLQNLLVIEGFLAKARGKVGNR